MKRFFSDQERKIIVNLITFSRFPLTLWSIYLFQVNRLFAIFVFIIAVTTDGIDGYLARRWNVTSTFGKFLDPIIDKLSIFSIFGIIIWRKFPIILTNKTLLIAGSFLFGMLIKSEIELTWLGFSAWRKIRKEGDLEIKRELGSNIFGKTKMGLEIITVIALFFFLKEPTNFIASIVLLFLFLSVIAAPLSLRKHLLDHEGVEDKIYTWLKKSLLFRRYEKFLRRGKNDKKSAEK